MVGSYLIAEEGISNDGTTLEKGQKFDRLTQTSIDFVPAAV